MAKYRQVQTQFWSDSFVIELTPEQKFFFLYLITNEQVKQCGIYEISTRQIVFDTGYNRDTVERLLEFFEGAGKIKYSKQTQEIAIKNFSKHNPQGSPKVKHCVNQELKHVKDRVLIGYTYGMDTVSQEEEEREEEREEEEKRIESGDSPSSLSFLNNDNDKGSSDQQASAQKTGNKQSVNKAAGEKVLLQAEKFEKIVVEVFNQSEVSHYSDEFKNWWIALCKSKKWKKKSILAFEISLSDLSKFDERFGIDLMKKAIASEWQGVVFDDTQEKYEKYLKGKPEGRTLSKFVA